MRPSTPESSSVSLVFQSTHSLRSATEKPGQRIRAAPGFNPRTPCGVRLLNAGFVPLKALFQSTHSLRSATPSTSDVSNASMVSIHALLAECDRPGVAGPGTRHRFNPRTPCGVRPSMPYRDASGDAFQSTHSLRSATQRPCQGPHALRFQSTHSLRSATLASWTLSRW